MKFRCQLCPPSPAWSCAVSVSMSRRTAASAKSWSASFAKLKSRTSNACRAHGRDDLADAGLPKTPRDKERLLKTLLSQDELDVWERTPRNAALSTKRTELQRAAPDYPPIAALIEVVKLAKLAEDFGPTLAARVSSVTGRIHARYLVAGTSSGTGHLQAAEPAADTAHIADRRLSRAVRSRAGQCVDRRRLLQHGAARRRRDQRRPRP